MNKYHKKLYRKDSIGMKFSKLIIIGISEREGFVKCRCECGNECEKFLSNIKRNYSKSCGCLKGESHGKSRDPVWKKTYASWQHMKGRCTRRKEIFFHNYGGRGIKVCERWNNSFKNFVEDMGMRPDGHTLDRIDVNGMYCPENCKWSTKTEQDNNRRATRFVHVNGEKMSFTQACRRFNISYWVCFYLVREKGKTHQEAIDLCLP